MPTIFFNTYFRMKRTLIALGVIGVLVLSACSATTDTKVPTAGKINPEDAAKMTETITPDSSKDSTTTAPSTTTTPPPASTQTVKQISMESGNFYFKPNVLTLKVNQPVKITFTNSGTHNFSIKEFGVDVELSGATGVVQFTPTKTGTFQFFCNVGNHMKMGQVGTLTVTE